MWQFNKVPLTAVPPQLVHTKTVYNMLNVDMKRQRRGGAVTET